MYCKLSGLENRVEQVFGNDKMVLTPSDYFDTEMAIQDHHAKKAGRHYDIRLLVAGRALSFATKKDLPTQPGQKIEVFRQPDHKPEYMVWQGRIPEGEYGFGEVKLHERQPIVAKMSEGKISFDVHDGQYKGRYALVDSDGRHFLIRKNDIAAEWHPRGKYKEAATEDVINNPAYVAMEKLDGAHVLVKVNPNGLGIVSLRKSVSGGDIRKEDVVPHLRDIKMPKELVGTVFRAELWSPEGFNVASGILNSKPANAVRAQSKVGKIMMTPFDIVKTPDGSDATQMPFSGRMTLLKALADSAASKYVRLPRMTLNDKQKFFDDIVADGGEGIVLRHLAKVGLEDVPIKMKGKNDYDLQITDYEPGQGRLTNNAVGAVYVADRSGRVVGKVGSGFTDAQRKDIFHNWQDYKGKLIKVETMPALKDQLRGPVFKGFSTDKNEPDEFKF